MAKNLSKMKGHHVRKSLTIAINKTVIKTRQNAAEKTARKFKVPIQRIRNTIPIKRASWKRLRGKITVTDIPIPLIALIRNSKGKNKGKINTARYRADKRGRRNKTGPGLFKINSLIGKGLKSHIKLNNAYIATTKRGHTQVFRRVNKHKQSSVRGDPKKKNKSYVPRLPTHKKLQKDVPRALALYNKTYFLKVLQHEYTQRWKGVIKTKSG